MKKKLLVCAVILAVFSFDLSGASFSPKVMVNGSIIPTDALLIDDRTYVPLRGVFEAAGAQVSWDEESGTAVINTGSAQQDTLVPGVIEKLSPSVVGIIGKCVSGSGASAYEYIAHGSGVVVKSGGEILTNAHVVTDMIMIFVVLNDGSSYEAKVKHIDEESDLALIKINKIGLPVAKFADTSDIVVGKMVVAIGTPISFSLRNSATVGYISGINRAVSGTYRLIQTDAAVNSGNSGGPLVNLDGEVIGINSSGYVGYGIESTNFAIPADTVNYVLRHFEAYGKVRRPSLKAELKEDWLAELGVPSEGGLTVRSMDKDSPLLYAEFANGDIISAINGTAVNSIVEVNELFKSFLPGDTVTVTAARGADIIEKQVVLAEGN